MARALAISAYKQIYDEEATLGEAHPEEWDFYATVACVSVAFLALTFEDFSEAEKQEAGRIAASSLDEWNSDWKRFYEDCLAFFWRSLEDSDEAEEDLAASSLLPDLFGMWLIWNLLKRCPRSTEELRLVRLAGTLTTRSFVGWWQQVERNRPNPPQT